MISLGRRIICRTQGHDWCTWRDHTGRVMAVICGRCRKVELR